MRKSADVLARKHGQGKQRQAAEWQTLTTSSVSHNPSRDHDAHEISLSCEWGNENYMSYAHKVTCGAGLGAV